MFVYVISAGLSAQKVGIASRPVSRLKELQTGNPATLRLIHTEDEGGLRAAQIEAQAHRILSRDRLAGEWFRVSPETAIAAVAQAVAELNRGMVVSLDEGGSCIRSVRLPRALWAALSERASGEGVTMNGWIARLVQAELSPDAPQLQALKWRRTVLHGEAK